MWTSNFPPTKSFHVTSGHSKQVKYTDQKDDKMHSVGLYRRCYCCTGYPGFCLCVVHFNDALSRQNIIVSNGRMDIIGYGRKLPSRLGTVPEFSCGY